MVTGMPDGGVLTGRRGQLLLVGGIAIAIVVVGTVVVLNGMQFTDTIGTSGDGGTFEDATRTQGMVERDLVELAAAVREDVGLVRFGAAFERNVSVYSRRYTQLRMEEGIAYVEVTVNRSAAGTGRLLEQNASAAPAGEPTFENNAGEENWTVAGNATAVRPFDLTIREFPNVVPGNQPTFIVRVENGSGRYWELRVNRTAGPTRTITTVTNDGRVARYQDTAAWFPASSPVGIDLRDGEINGTDVPGLTFADGVDPPYDVSYNATGPTGTGVVAKGVYRVATDSQRPPANAQDHPNVTAIVTEPGVDVVYEGPDARWNTTVRVEEGS